MPLAWRHRSTESEVKTVKGLTKFPKSFIWGTATASYQIEGAVSEDGRGPSIWDRFCHTPGNVVNDETGDVACDHYHHWQADLRLLKSLGVNAYRFSIAWPRIIPDGAGTINPKGLDFYDRLIDHLLQDGIEPFPTLYHWDLPQALEDRGGWTNRDSAGWFTDYATAVVGRFGDRVKRWVTFNEPNVFTILGYGVGEHAPGLRGEESMLRAINNVNRAHGLATRSIRGLGRGNEVGIVVVIEPYRPAAPDKAYREAAARLDCLWNRALVDPALLGRNAEGMLPLLERVAHSDDETDFADPVDFFGLNHYGPAYVAPSSETILGAKRVAAPAGTPLTEMNTPIDPAAFRETLLMLRARYGDLPIYITENGCAFPDRPDEFGRIHDGERIKFLRDYLGAALDAFADGCNIKGYFVWSFLDNFEWAHGYSKRFGLVHIDDETRDRTPKDSFTYFREVAASGDPRFVP
jgi:beta-glucosidase